MINIRRGEERGITNFPGWTAGTHFRSATTTIPGTWALGHCA
jgi:hypothetical protein